MFSHLLRNIDSAKIIVPLVALAILGTGLTGCTTAHVDQTRLAPIQSVFLKPISNRHVEVRNPFDFDWTPSTSDPSLNDVVAKQGLQLGIETYSSLTKSLERAGYRIMDAPNTADAVIEVVIDRAFYNMEPPIAGGGCEPFALFDVSITNARTGETILSHTYRYQSGGGTGMTGHILLDAGSTYNVDDCKTLWTNPQVPVEGFRAAEVDLARALETEIKKPSSIK